MNCLVVRSTSGIQVNVETVHNQHTIGGVMIIVVTSGARDGGFEPLWCHTRLLKLIVVASPLSIIALRSKNKNWLSQIRIMCSSGPTFLPTGCYISELAI